MGKIMLSNNVFYVPSDVKITGVSELGKIPYFFFWKPSLRSCSVYRAYKVKSCQKLSKVVKSCQKLSKVVKSC